MIKLRHLLCVLLVFAGKGLFAQAIVKAWGGGADQNDLSFGFTFQYVSTDLRIEKKPDWRSPFYDPQTGTRLTDSLNGISSRPSQGFAIGIISRYRLTDHLEARLTPNLVFADRILSYSYAGAMHGSSTSGTTNGDVVDKQIQTSMVDIPLSIKLKSDRLGNFRAYLLGGVKYSAVIGTKKTDDQLSPIDKLVKNTRGFASYEAGIGCDIYFEFFKLSPEIKISNSFRNVLVPENHAYSRPIDKLFLHQLMFSLYFE